MSAQVNQQSDVLVLGAGIIGLSCALEFADRGARVLIYDPVWPPRGASWAAAGMIAPAFEAAGLSGVHPELFELCLRSAELWPDWSRRLEARTERATGYDGKPSRAFAIREEEAEALDRIKARLAASRLPFQELKEWELIGPAKQGLELPTDTQVDNRMAMGALIEACEKHHGVSVARARPTEYGGKTLVTAGWCSSEISPVKLPIYPLSGQMISLARGGGDPDRPVRCGSLYIVPKSDRVIIGATVERGVVRSEPDPEALQGLRNEAEQLFPQFDGREVLEEWAGVRPGTPDHAPYLGEVEDGVFVAAGHHRNGILLAPLTAGLMADLALEGQQDELLDRFSPLRAAAVTQS